MVMVVIAETCIASEGLGLSVEKESRGGPAPQEVP